MELLAKNPSHSSLRTKRIQGTTDLFECSVNMDIRIIWYYEGDKMIILVDIIISSFITLDKIVDRVIGNWSGWG